MSYYALSQDDVPSDLSPDAVWRLVLALHREGIIPDPESEDFDRQHFLELAIRLARDVQFRQMDRPTRDTVKRVAREADAEPSKYAIRCICEDSYGLCLKHRTLMERRAAAERFMANVEVEESGDLQIPIIPVLED